MRCSLKKCTTLIKGSPLQVSVIITYLFHFWFPDCYQSGNRYFDLKNETHKPNPTLCACVKH